MIQQTIGPLDNGQEAQTKATSHDHLAWQKKNILQGTMRGGKRRGRQKKVWEDNTKGWTEMEFANSQKAVGNRRKRRGLVAKSSVEPQRPVWVMGKWSEEELMFTIRVVCLFVAFPLYVRMIYVLLFKFYIFLWFFFCSNVPCKWYIIVLASMDKPLPKSFILEQ